VGGEQSALLVQAREIDRQFLAQRRRHGGLAVRAREQRRGPVLACQRAEPRAERLQRGQQDGVARVTQRLRLRDQIHILRSQTKVQPCDPLRERVAASFPRR